MRRSGGGGRPLVSEPFREPLQRRGRRARAPEGMAGEGVGRAAAVGHARGGVEVDGHRRQLARILPLLERERRVALFDVLLN